jgi:hypothetical protein
MLFPSLQIGGATDSGLLPRLHDESPVRTQWTGDSYFQLNILPSLKHDEIEADRNGFDFCVWGQAAFPNPSLTITTAKTNADNRRWNQWRRLSSGLHYPVQYARRQEICRWN